MPVCRSATIKITKPLEISVTTRNHPHAADAVNLILIVARGITLIVARYTQSWRDLPAVILRFMP